MKPKALKGQDPLEQAKHNERVSGYLYKDPVGCFDWVVTTAFYSALHYIAFQLFPLIRGAATYTDFDHYYSETEGRKSISQKRNKHEATMALVNQELQPISAYYRSLMTACHNARYRDYRIKKAEADQALQELQLIKAGLDKVPAGSKKK